MYANKVTLAREDIVEKKGVKSRWQMGVRTIIKDQEYRIQYVLKKKKKTLYLTPLISQEQLESVTEN